MLVEILDINFMLEKMESQYFSYPIICIYQYVMSYYNKNSIDSK